MSLDDWIFFLCGVYSPCGFAERSVLLPKHLASLLLPRRSGTHWQTNCELTRVTDLRQPWKVSFSPCTSVYSALEALLLMRYINLRLTWLDLTWLGSDVPIGKFCQRVHRCSIFYIRLWPFAQLLVLRGLKMTSSVIMSSLLLYSRFLTSIFFVSIPFCP